MIPARPLPQGYLHAEPTARDMALLLELRHDYFRGIGWNVEANADRAAGRGEDRSVHADHVAVHVEGRTAGITLVDGRDDLDEVVIRAVADVAAVGRDDARRHGAAEAEGIADRNHPVANPRPLLGEFDERKVLLAVDLDQREIGLRIGADDLCGVDCRPSGIRRIRI